MRAVFMGTPDFAIPCLERMIRDGHEIAAVFCQPDRPKGRGYKLVPPPVKVLAEEQGIPVHQPVKMRDGTVAALLQDIAPDVIVVVAYGRILPPDILAIPRYGCVNVHASLLPKLRGAAPIQWSIINGDAVTGVTTMFMAEGLDTGDAILRRETPIGAEETAGELFERLSAMGADCLSETLPLLESGNCPRTPQDDSLATYAPMIGKDMAFLDFSRPAEELCCLIRGLNPSPVAKTCFEGKLIRVLKARPVPDFSGAPGEILDNKRFIVACGDGAIEFTSVQPEGKKCMDASAFICGRRDCKGTFCTVNLSGEQ
ncbi:methionyl-tRNA formyltransferase [Ruminococcaceae bacterium OttesenSCG-928-L11]|nr:methionyl-tRNA formyltransferase [Ruminococcaceae bacterium OttesenSCG-928-L11]